MAVWSRAGLCMWRILRGGACWAPDLGRGDGRERRRAVSLEMPFASSIKSTQIQNHRHAAALAMHLRTLLLLVLIPFSASISSQAELPFFSRRRGLPCTLWGSGGCKAVRVGRVYAKIRAKIAI